MPVVELHGPIPFKKFILAQLFKTLFSFFHFDSFLSNTQDNLDFELYKRFHEQKDEMSTKTEK